MDTKGAQELAQLLRERQGGDPVAPVRAQVVSAGAAPIFHWVGVEPPADTLSVREDEALAETRAFWRRRTRGRR